MKYSIVIPCYNEEANLPELIDSLKKYNINKDIEYVLVENGSEDNSYAVLKSLTDGQKYFNIIRVGVNRGYGYGIAQGVQAAQGDYIGWLHADLQVGLYALDSFLKFIEDHNYPENILLKGRRFNRKPIEYLFTNGQAIFETLLFRTLMYDISAIPVLFHKSLRDKLTKMPDGFEIELYIYLIAKHNKYEIIRYPVRMVERINGESSWNKGFFSRIHQSIQIIMASIKMKKTLWE